MKTFILVEDDPMDAAHFLAQAAMWPELNHKATLQSVPAALNYLTSCVEKPDIIFSDINLPWIDGLSVAESFRNLCLVLIYVSGESGHEKRVLKELAHGMLWKPVQAAEIKRTVEAWFDRGKGEVKKEPEPAPMILSLSSVMLYDGSEKASYRCEIRDMQALVHQRNYIDVLVRPDIRRTIRMSVSEALMILAPVKLFIQINQSTIINVIHIQKAEKKEVYVGEKEERSWIKYHVTMPERGYDNFRERSVFGKGSI